jgi:hypothetical protein
MRYSYHAARYEARVMRFAYKRGLRWFARAPLRSERFVNWHVVSFSSSRDMPEQVASIRSLLRYAGVPLSLTVVGDGSHTGRDRRLLESISPIVRVAEWSNFASGLLDPRVAAYAAVHPLGKKLATIMCISAYPVFYCDSDVLFLRPVTGRGPFDVNGGTNWYLGDGDGGLDQRLLREDEREKPANAGCFFAGRPLEMISFVDRLTHTPTRADVYAEQTLVHLALHSADAEPLPPEFVLTFEDQFLWTDFARKESAVLRHYASSVRHKFWVAVARDLF